MGRPLTLALVQAPGRSPGDLDGFMAHAENTLKTCPNTQLLAYPELHLAGDDTTSLSPEEILASAEPLTDGPRHRRLSALAVDLGVWLCPGSIVELGKDGHRYYTAIVYSPTGELVAAYRKIFPWRPYEQVRPGRRFVVFDIPGTGRIGLSICFDAWFPETSRHLAWMGADLILNLVKTPTVDRSLEVVLARANAIVNQVYVASVNASGPSGLGHSLLVGPEGYLLGELPGATPGVLTAVVDLDAVDNARRYGTCALTRVWEQIGDDDEPLLLPLYDGSISAPIWSKIGTRRSPTETPD